MQHRLHNPVHEYATCNAGLWLNKPCALTAPTMPLHQLAPAHIKSRIASYVMNSTKICPQSVSSSFPVQAIVADCQTFSKAVHMKQGGIYDGDDEKWLHR